MRRELVCVDEGQCDLTVEVDVLGAPELQPAGAAATVMQTAVTVRTLWRRRA